VIEGGDTELDKSVIERITDPLMHMVRNSIDHGIESPAIRTEAGKEPRAILKMRAYHESGAIAIEISDDGAGLNRQKIQAKAASKGLIKPNQELSDSEINNLIFEAGFSTAEQLSNVSGRGVGMDVVKRNIEELNGQIAVESITGKGCKFTIKLPLTMAIIDGFHVNVGDSSYIIPLGMVDECIELNEELRSVENKGNFINLRGDVLPFVRLSELFGREDLRKKRHSNDKSHRDNIVVVRCGEEKTGLVVDELLGERQAVIKPLGKLFQNLNFISGATILGGGNVAMILDIPQLVNRVTSRSIMH
jgi:two-component system chemotaxis sensor kinase CheA